MVVDEASMEFLGAKTSTVTVVEFVTKGSSDGFAWM